LPIEPIAPFLRICKWLDQGGAGGLSIVFHTVRNALYPPSSLADTAPGIIFTSVLHRLRNGLLRGGAVLGMAITTTWHGPYRGAARSRTVIASRN
jgi:hypothetical protein